MASFNKVILMGNLTRDPELKSAPSGSKVSELGLAVSERWQDKSSGEPRETVCFVDVTVWNRLAELCHQYLRKGSPVLVEGRLQMDEWKNQQGERRTKLRVRANVVKFIGPAPKREQEPDTSAQARGVEGSPQIPDQDADFVDSAADGSIDDEDLPF